ncbi:MAG: hypothetical protein FRX49_01178 [Trebouxia sp. A1-2]|nr:MAG: hypothetical protein FRX49_01178 [Trebouxia sp. A1-2]
MQTLSSNWMQGASPCSSLLRSLGPTSPPDTSRLSGEDLGLWLPVGPEPLLDLTALFRIAVSSATLALSSATCLRAAAARASAESALSLSSLKATVAPADPVQPHDRSCNGHQAEPLAEEEAEAVGAGLPLPAGVLQLVLAVLQISFQLLHLPTPLLKLTLQLLHLLRVRALPRDAPAQALQQTNQAFLCRHGNA